DERFAFPQLSVTEIVRISGIHRAQRIKNAPVLRLRDKLLPLLHFKETLQLDIGDDECGFVVVMQTGSQSFGVIVDTVLHTEEIVVKPISSKLRHLGIFSGVTILGDGSVIIVVDPNALTQTLGRATQSSTNYPPEHTKRDERTDQGTVSLLIFRSGSQRRKAVPLSVVTRIEEVDCSTIEPAENRFVMQYRGELIPLFGVDPQ